ncbi:hypothetical protein QR680_014403 [Steinernema hermaphroditum]|uniref:Uncharacterized protein n=1 Tax=Steinernema hermaphroditum TaxID=289476 RepID=A0AA39I8S8_9BILA|nr:hypothetical protein QR680_014403 [Steinernema hermaphroditum]
MTTNLQCFKVYKTGLTHGFSISLTDFVPTLLDMKLLAIIFVIFCAFFAFSEAAKCADESENCKYLKPFCNDFKYEDMLAVAARIRFIHLGIQYDATFDPGSTVGSVWECSVQAFYAKRIGFRINVVEKGMTCALLKSFNRFRSVSGKNVRDYILNTNFDAECDQNKNPADYLTGPCGSFGNGCALLEKIKDYCVFVGGNCISDQGLVDALNCPSGQERVGARKDKVICCPEGEQFAEEKNGKTFCCPNETILKELVDEQPVCCAPSDNYVLGSATCCPQGKSWKVGAMGIAGCCEYGRQPAFSSDGYSEGCCPPGEVFAEQDDDIEYCCPEGKEYKGFHKEKAICCESGQEAIMDYEGDMICGN